MCEALVVYRIGPNCVSNTVDHAIEACKGVGATLCMNAKTIKIEDGGKIRRNEAVR